MWKKCFNDTWLDKVESNSHIVHLWCIKKMKEQQHANSVKKDINTVYWLCSLEAELREIRTLKILNTFESVSHRP